MHIHAKMFLLVLVLSAASGATVAAYSERSCTDTIECEPRGSSMISAQRVTVTSPGIVEDYSAAKLADAPDAVMLAADDWGVVIEEEGTQPQGTSSTLTPRSRLQTVGSALVHAYTICAVYHACILLAGFLLAATTHGLHRAIAERMAPSVDKLQWCRDTGSEEANQTDGFGCTALHVAAHGGSADAVRALLAANADANAREAWDETPLHFAARSGNAEVCTALLKVSAEANALNASGCTPLVEAACAGKRASCSVLLDHGGHAGGILDEHLPPMLSMLILSRIVAAGHATSCCVPG
jgi:hypothetical protein